MHTEADGRYTYKTASPTPTASGMPLYIHMTAIHTEADDRKTYRNGWPLDIQKRKAASKIAGTAEA